MHLLLIAFARSLGTIKRILDNCTKRLRGDKLRIGTHSRCHIRIDMPTVKTTSQG
jgi:hypothetical protein